MSDVGRRAEFPKKASHRRGANCRFTTGLRSRGVYLRILWILPETDGLQATSTSTRAVAADVRLRICPSRPPPSFVSSGGTQLAEKFNLHLLETVSSILAAPEVLLGGTREVFWNFVPNANPLRLLGVCLGARGSLMLVVPFHKFLYFSLLTFCSSFPSQAQTQSTAVDVVVVPVTQTRLLMTAAACSFFVPAES